MRTLNIFPQVIGNIELPKLNTLGCPQCGSELCDTFPVLEKNKTEKTVKCSNIGCDYTAKRSGFRLFR